MASLTLEEALETTRYAASLGLLQLGQALVARRPTLSCATSHSQRRRPACLELAICQRRWQPVKVHGSRSKEMTMESAYSLVMSLWQSI